MTRWALNLPIRTRFDTLADLSSNVLEAERAGSLSSDDAAVAHELVIVAAQSGMQSAQHIEMVLEDMTPDVRRWALDRIRERAGLKTTSQADAIAAAEAATRAAQLRAPAPIPVCAANGCQAIPIDAATGAPTPVNANRWHCPEHADQAQPGDMEPRPRVTMRFTASGAYEPGPDPIDAAREATRAADEIRRRQLERDQQLRERAAEPRPSPPETPANLAVPRP